MSLLTHSLLYKCTLLPGTSEKLPKLRQTGIAMPFSWSSAGLGNLLNTHSAPKPTSWRNCLHPDPAELVAPGSTLQLPEGTWPINSQVIPIQKWPEGENSVPKSWSIQTISWGSWKQKEAQKVVALGDITSEQMLTPANGKQKTSLHTSIHSFIQ